ncbi:MAG: GNAT family N-acetyltransferase [Flavobacteriales bacterium]|nr:GNAT family N-acetyltransferase [Flavobacteriales bacterium]
MLTLNFSPFPKIVTERLILREIDMGDVDALFDIRSDERVMRYIGRSKAKEKSDSIELIERIIRDLKENTSISWATLKDASQVDVRHNPHYDQTETPSRRSGLRLASRPFV